ncbi:MAG TPA: 4-oxalocrotonate tautomerase family protein, partial [Desulfurivibrionaceae bacterium]|nr:4-oxalocrotonate tautomerase family protein [Desulfurivibrionaceae bacterium]
PPVTATAHQTTREGNIMPYVNIRLAGQLQTEQKAEICKGVTEVIAKATGKPKDSILIFIDECERENIASGGVLLSSPK